MSDLSDNTTQKVPHEQTTGNIRELQAKVRKLELDNSYMQLDLERLQDAVRELERVNSRY